MNLDLNDFVITPNSLGFPLLGNLVNPHNLFANLILHLINKYESEIVPAHNENFYFEVFSNDSQKYDKLRIHTDAISVKENIFQFTFSFEFINYELPTNFTAKTLQQLFYYSYLEELVYLDRTIIPNCGDDLEDILFSLFNVLGLLQTNAYTLSYLGWRFINDIDSHTFLLIVKQSLLNINED